MLPAVADTERAAVPVDSRSGATGGGPLSEAAGELDPRLAAALAVQLRQWRAALDGGAERVGWKLGMGDRERIGGEVAIGHLTSTTELAPGGVYHAGPGVDLHADAEVAVRLGHDPDAGAAPVIAGVAAALELVDLARPPDDPVSVVAGNVFHLAVAFGPFQPPPALEGVRAGLVVNGRLLASAPVAGDVAGRVGAAGRLLRAMGERLEAGDRVITGSVVQVPVGVGDQVVAEFGPLGRVQLSVAGPAPPG
jgi:2-keto-4-pentenoate hydratase